jgi:hypothetical protein
MSASSSRLVWTILFVRFGCLALLPFVLGIAKRLLDLVKRAKDAIVVLWALRLALVCFFCVACAVEIVRALGAGVDYNEESVRR